jgi:hypothetical protein
MLSRRSIAQPIKSERGDERMRGTAVVVSKADMCAKIGVHFVADGAKARALARAP